MNDTTRVTTCSMLENLVKQLEDTETELYALRDRLDKCSGLLWRLRPDCGYKPAGSFGPEYEWVEDLNKILEDYAPDYELITGAYILKDDDEVQEVWVTDGYHPKACGHGIETTRYSRVF